MSSDAWVSANGIDVTQISLEPPRKNSNSFFLLRDFHGGADGRVWLACYVEKTEKCRSGDNEEDLAAAEVSRWHALGFKRVYHTKLSNRNAVVMPFGFHYTKDQTIDTTWWNPPEVNPPIIDFSQVLDLATNADPIDVLNACIERCAETNLVHSDIEWRHVAICH